MAGNKEKSISEAVIKIMLLVCIILLIAVLAFITVSLFRTGNSDTVKESQESVRRNVVVLSDKADSSSFAPDIVNTSSEHDVKMNSTWVFQNGKTYSKDAYVENPLSNKNSVFFDVYVDGSDQVLFTSPVLPVGSHIENIAFDKILSKGSYNGTVKYTLLGSDGETGIGTLQVAVKIIIQG